MYEQSAEQALQLSCTRAGQQITLADGSVKTCTSADLVDKSAEFARQTLAAVAWADEALAPTYPMPAGARLKARFTTCNPGGTPLTYIFLFSFIS
jgi:hypothetical protein